MAIGLETLDLVKIHEQALITLVSPSSVSRIRDGVIKRAGTFFIRALTPIEKTHRAALEANGHLNQLNETLSQPAVELAATNRQLKHEIVQRKAAEEALKKSEQHYSLLLEESRHMQEHLRHLSHQVLSAQEEERKQISRELHDEIAQTLTGINISLATLTKEATVNTSSLKKKIVSTQQLCGKIDENRASVRSRIAPDALGRTGAYSRPSFVYEKFYETDWRPHSFHGLC